MRIRSSLPVALGLPLALGLPQPCVPAWAAPVAQSVTNIPAPAAAPSTPLIYREVRPQLLPALRDCTSPQPLELCEPASQRLQELIVISQRPLARERRPRCLGALTQLETHLTVFRWGFEPKEHLQTMIQQVEQACPPTLSAAPAASN